MNKPNPLSDEVQHRADADQLNIHAAAEIMGVESTPVSELPRWLRDEAKRKEKAREEIDAADAATVSKLRAWDQYQAAVLEAGEIARDIEAGEHITRAANGALANQQSAFDSWPKHYRENRWQLVHNTLLDLDASERILKLMPQSLQALRAKLAEVKKALTAAEKQYGFGFAKD